MTMRLEYLEEKGYLDVSCEYSKKYHETVEKKAANLKINCLKFNQTKNTRILGNMQTLLTKIYNNELLVLNGIVKML
jgi:hypothetical protein